MILHFSQIFLTDGLTFTTLPPSVLPAFKSIFPILAQNFFDEKIFYTAYLVALLSFI